MARNCSIHFPITSVAHQREENVSTSESGTRSWKATALPISIYQSPLLRCLPANLEMRNIREAGLPFSRDLGASGMGKATMEVKKISLCQPLPHHAIRTTAIVNKVFLIVLFFPLHSPKRVKGGRKSDLIKLFYTLQPDFISLPFLWYSPHPLGNKGQKVASITAPGISQSPNQLIPNEGSDFHSA